MAIISIVIPVFNEQENIKILLQRLMNVVKGSAYEFEIIIINDGSSDESLTVINHLAEVYTEVKLIDFSRNFGQQNALRAGYDNAIGEAVICMDADLQNPPELILDMLQKWENGYEVVICRRKNGMQHSGLLKELSSKFFYRVLNLISDTEIEQDAPDFRLVDKKISDIIKALPERDIFLRGLISWLGYKKVVIEYLHEERLNGKTGYSSFKMFKLALSGLTGFSIKPLYIAIYLGVIISGLSFLYIIYAIVRHYMGDTISGWSSLIIAVTFLGGLQLFVLGIIGLYLGKLFMQAKGRPEYLIRKITS